MKKTSMPNPFKSHGYTECYNQLENSHKQCNEIGQSVDGKSVETRTTTWRESQFKTKTSIREKKQTQKSWTQRITIWDRSRKVNNLIKVVSDRKTIIVFIRSISSTIIDYPVLMMDVKVSKDKCISRWDDRENLIYVLWNEIKNCGQRWRRSLKKEKEVRHWVK